MDTGLFVNTERPKRTFGEAWDEDLFEVELADRLGMEEAWISDHGATPELLISKAARATTQIRMGAGIRPLPFHHPLQIAIEANACDHLTDGRYMLGIGLGGPESGAKAMDMRGIDDSRRREMMHEAIDYIVTAFTATEPFDYDGEFWHGKSINLRPKSVQNPHPPIAISSTGSASTMVLAAERDFDILLSQYSTPQVIRDAGDLFSATAKALGNDHARSKMRAIRYVYVADSMKQAKEDLREAMTASIERHVEFFPHHYEHVLPPSGRVEDVNFDYLIDVGNYCVGDPDTVYEAIKSFYDESGGFGVLLLTSGKDFGTREQRERSWTMFAEEVAPRLKELDPDRDSSPVTTTA